MRLFVFVQFYLFFSVLLKLVSIRIVGFVIINTIEIYIYMYTCIFIYSIWISNDRSERESRTIWIISISRSNGYEFTLTLRRSCCVGRDNFAIISGYTFFTTLLFQGRLNAAQTNVEFITCKRCKKRYLRICMHLNDGFSILFCATFLYWAAQWLE